MKKLIITAIALIGVAFATAQNCQMEQQDYVEVRGTAKVMVDPNKAEISITLSQEESKGKMTMSQLEDQLAKALKEAGVDAAKQLVLADQSSEAKKHNKGYQFKNYILTVSSATEAQSVFQAFALNGVNNASVTKIWNDKQKDIEMKLKVDAILDAQNSAKTLTGAIGQSIGKAIQITDYSYNNNFVSMDNSSFARKASAVAGVAELPELDFKQIRIEQSVTVRFSLK